MESLKYIPYLFLILAVAGIVAGASVLTISKFKSTTTDAPTLATLGNVSSGMSTVSEQFPTIGIIAVMVIIISLIAGVFVYMRMFA
jgi:hypothetical protein